LEKETMRRLNISNKLCMPCRLQALIEVI
jgi:hypothetical protein